MCWPSCMPSGTAPTQQGGRHHAGAVEQSRAAHLLRLLCGRRQGARPSRAEASLAGCTKAEHWRGLQRTLQARTTRSEPVSCSYSMLLALATSPHSACLRCQMSRTPVRSLLLSRACQGPGHPAAR